MSAIPQFPSVDPAALIAAAGKLEQVGTDIRATTPKISGLYAGQSWAGAGGSAFQQATGRMAAPVAALEGQITSAADALRTAASQLETAKAAYELALKQYQAGKKSQAIDLAGQRTMSLNGALPVSPLLQLPLRSDQIATNNAEAAMQSAVDKVHQVVRQLDTRLASVARVVLGQPSSGGVGTLATPVQSAVSRAQQKLVDLAGGGRLGTSIASAMALTGVSVGWASPLHTLVMRESGGNPNDVNNWDSNAAQGTPSIGLAQVIQPTFDQYAVAGHHDIRKPVDNVAAAIGYIKSRYGDISNVQQANANLPPKGY